MSNIAGKVYAMNLVTPQLANEKNALTGNHGKDPPGPSGAVLIQAEPSRDEPPFFCSRMPRFVETRGGEYFFVPSLTALRMIAEGRIDPT